MLGVNRNASVTEQELLDAFHQRGEKPTTVEDLCAHLGCTHGQASASLQRSLRRGAVVAIGVTRAGATIYETRIAT